MILIVTAVILRRAKLGSIIGCALLAVAAYPRVERWRAGRELAAQLDRANAAAPGDEQACVAMNGWSPGAGRGGGPLLASWQSVGGCGATAGAGVGAGVKWIGRGVSGGLFNVQCLGSYTQLRGALDNEEQYFATTLITGDLSERWSAGVAIPYAYKYLHDPYGHQSFDKQIIDLSNSGLADVSVQLTTKLGPILATALTASLTLPTGTHDATYKMSMLRQHQQLGFGKVAGSLMLDHTYDELWGLVVLGGVASWRGGENDVQSYRPPSGSVYAYTGYFLGPLVPALGLSVTGLPSHDRDQGNDEETPLYTAALNASLELSTSWMAILVAGSLPYRYDGILLDQSGRPRSPWGFAPWTVSVGLSFAPF
jgi:hypothetical protein